MPLKAGHVRILAILLFFLPAAALADMYGKVEDGRVSIVISDTPPVDPGYFLFKKGAKVELDGALDARLAQLRYAESVFAAAKETKVDAALIHAVIHVES